MNTFANFILFGIAIFYSLSKSFSLTGKQLLIYYLFAYTENTEYQEERTMTEVWVRGNEEAF